ncbi:MAG TPA: cyclic peptide export ABC transporter [Burkholderiales bacterium]|nr:cyclic peptide export ABC transporter [Burkholderiales bacterium]
MLQTFRELQRYFTAEDRRQWLVLLASSLATGLAQSLTLALFNEAVAKYGRGESHLLYLPLVLGLAALGIASGYYGALRGHLVSTRMSIRLRDRLLDELAGGNLRVVERVGTNALHYHLMVTVHNLASAYETLLTFATSFVMLTCMFAYVGWLSPVGLLCGLAIAAIGVTVHFRQERKNVPRKRALDDLTNESHRRHREVLEGYKELRLYGEKFTHYRGYIDALNRDTVVKGQAVMRTSTAGELATYFFQFAMIATLVFALPWFVRLDAVVIMQLMTAILVTVGPLSGVVGAIPGFTRARIALHNLQNLQREIAETREAGEAQHGRTLPPFEKIELKGIEFSFGNETAGESFHLGPVDFALTRGEIVFVVGGNGSGKTVLMRLLTALYHASAGGIEYNGVPLAAEDRQAYREKFSTVFSDFHLFRELLGLEGASREEVNAWLARLDLKGKTEYRDGEFSSVALSAGQRKRLAFAVAMLEDRPIYVLDEFGAEQDPEHRRSFYREILPGLREAGKTVIVVTHDDAYFDAADRIIRMDFGKVVNVEDNAHAEGKVVNVQENVRIEEDHPIQKAALVR